MGNPFPVGKSLVHKSQQAWREKRLNQEDEFRFKGIQANRVLHVKKFRSKVFLGGL